MTDSHRKLAFAFERLCKRVRSIAQQPQENVRFDTPRSRFIPPCCRSRSQQHQDVTNPDKLNWKLGVRKKAPVVMGNPATGITGEYVPKERAYKGVFLKVVT